MLSPCAGAVETGKCCRLYQEGVRSGRSEGEEDAAATSTLAASRSPCIDTIHKYSACLKYNLGIFAPPLLLSVCVYMKTLAHLLLCASASRARSERLHDATRVRNIYSAAEAARGRG